MQVFSTLDLVRDYSRFVISFFEVISVSAPHIYHSALLLSPQTSITRRLYKQYAHPFARVVRGLPESWEPISASANLVNFEGYTAWSPCSKFIAIAKRGSTEILDAVTLNRLKTFKPPHDSFNSGLSFTPDGRSLTQFGYAGLINWDVQTGGPLSAIKSESSWFPQYIFSLTYSVDGKMIAVAYEDLLQARKDGDGDDDDDDDDDSDDYYWENPGPILIAIFDLFGTHIHTCRVPKEPLISLIWAHGQCFRFATTKSSFITIWEVPSTSPHELAEVESLPIPDKFIEDCNMLFFPPLSRLALTFKQTIQIWDAKSPKFLLKPEASPGLHFDPAYRPHRSWCSFSLSGHLFACIADAGVYVWKDSPSGYILHQKFPFILTFNPTTGPRLSPDGESIITPFPSVIHLWPTRNQILPPSNVPAGDDVEGDSVLAFSPNELFAAFARGSVVKILDLRSGDLLSATDMDMKISCLWMTQNTVVVVAGGKIVSWRMPGENCGVKSGANVKDSAQTITLDRSSTLHYATPTSVSPDLRRIAVSEHHPSPLMDRLEIYDVFTGRSLGGIDISTRPMVHKFTLDGCWIRDIEGHSAAKAWEIVEDSQSDAINLVPMTLGGTMRQPGLFPLHSSCGFEVTGDGWVLSPAHKRRLWVPQRWRSDQRYRTWSGRFLGLFYPELSDPVILEFFE